MKRKTGIFLIIGVLVLILLTGCGTGTEETASEDSKEADKLQIGLSFDSFVIERWLRDRDMFCIDSTGAGSRSKCAGSPEAMWMSRFLRSSILSRRRWM